jgi:hypothetical protein
MEDGFEIPVWYRDKELSFPARLASFGWTHRILVDVFGLEVSFERDEEREWRALVKPEDLEAGKNVDIPLLEAIRAAIDRILS